MGFNSGFKGLKVWTGNWQHLWLTKLLFAVCRKSQSSLTLS